MKNTIPVSVWKIFAVLISCTPLLGCRSFRGQIVNDTGGDIQIMIKGTDGHAVGFGPLERGTSLSLSQSKAEIGSVDYRLASGLNCHVDRKLLVAGSSDGPGIWTVHLHRC